MLKYLSKLYKKNVEVYLIDFKQVLVKHLPKIIYIMNVQLYRCTDVRLYTCTNVRLYKKLKCTVVQVYRNF